jgi:class 3 adenylate cyclase/predicted ATPase
VTFEEILDQTLAMLQRRGRVTYRTLQRQFSLDEAALEDLKAALLYEHPQVVDNPGQGLMWKGDPPSTPQAIPQDAHPAQAEPLPTDSRSPDAERRQLTVLFCDLVESTALSAELDPEELREVVRAYQATCAEVIQRFDGYIAQYLGDGLLVYFGYPQAHEDDAPRAVRAGLGILEAMGPLRARLTQERGVSLAVRLGIHTGPVVVGTMGGGDRQEQLALGEAPNIAARLQGLAEPDTMVVSAETYRLVQGFVTCDDLGAQTLKGVAAPVRIYRVLGESGAQSRLDVAMTRGLTPLVGREAEVTLLLERWAQAKERQGQVVVLSGEAGIGKSRLMQELQARAASEGATRMVFRCSPYHQQSALYPVIEHLQRLLEFHRHDTPTAKLDKLEHVLREDGLPPPEAVPLFATLLSLPPPEHYPPLHLSPQRQRQKTQEALMAWLLAETERQPVLAVWEDLHWADPSTLELLSLVLEQTPVARLLTLLTCRPEFRPPWSSRSYIMPLTLNRLGHSQVEVMITRLTGGTALPAEVLQQIVAKTDGVPLFVEELTKAVLESALLQNTDGRYELTTPLPILSIPATLQDSLMARLDRLVTAKGLAQFGATFGRQFTYELLQAVTQLDDVTLQRELARLVDAELLFQRGMPPRASYIFKHALIQEIAYQSLLKRTRQQYHQRIAQVLEEGFPEIATAQPELLAQHYTEASLPEQAIPYWQRAGQQALQRSAYPEAISLLTRELQVLHILPETSERDRQELDVQITLGQALSATKGHAAPEVIQVYTRARALCEPVGETTQRFAVLGGLRTLYEQRGELTKARELAEQLLHLAQSTDDQAHLERAYTVLGQTLFFLGEFVPARASLEWAMALYDPAGDRAVAVGSSGQIQAVTSRRWSARTLWYLGYPDQALQRSHEAIALAQELPHPYSLTYALNFAAILHCLRREDQSAQERAEAAIALSREQGFTQQLAAGMILRGWALAMQGQHEKGGAQLRQGLAARQAAGAEVGLGHSPALLAEAYGRIGRVGEGLSLLGEVLRRAQKVEERYHEAELYRLNGELLLARDTAHDAEAETNFQQALTVARRQQVKSLELRAAMSLARLWQQQGQRQEARDLLAPIYGWFTEGFDTADLREAKGLLDEWA